MSKMRKKQDEENLKAMLLMIVSLMQQGINPAIEAFKETIDNEPKYAEVSECFRNMKKELDKAEKLLKAMKG